jgi:hypothetical protein
MSQDFVQRDEGPGVVGVQFAGRQGAWLVVHPST